MSKSRWSLEKILIILRNGHRQFVCQPVELNEALC